MKYLVIIFLVFLLFSCNKENEVVEVIYRLSNGYSKTFVAYQKEEGDLQKDTLYFESGEDVKNYTIDVKKGDIVYLSALYEDSLSSISLEILLDGKIFKSSSSNNEAGKYVIVSATVPF